MRRPVFFVFSSAMLLIIVFALLSQSLFIAQRVARASSIEGKVEVQRDGTGTWVPLQRDNIIKTGDVVRTGPRGSAEFTWIDGTRWKVMPRSSLIVRKAIFNTANRHEDSQLMLTSGKVFVRIVKPRAEGSRFEVGTPTAVATVRGTIFSVEVQNGRTQVAVYKGLVRVQSVGATAVATIQPGQTAIAAAGKVSTLKADESAAFQAQPSIVLPHAKAEVAATTDSKSTLSVRTEPGDTVTVDGKPVRELLGGLFVKPVELKRGENAWQVIVTDRHGAVTVLRPSLNFDPNAKAKIEDGK